MFSDRLTCFRTWYPSGGGVGKVSVRTFRRWSLTGRQGSLWA